MSEAIERIAAVLGGLMLDCTDEYRMQDGIAAALADADIPAKREAVLSIAERIDFLALGVGIECKVDGSASEVARQVVGYLQHPRVEALILVTARARLGRGLPSTITVSGQAKPVRVIETWRGSL